MTQKLNPVAEQNRREDTDSGDTLIMAGKSVAQVALEKTLLQTAKVIEDELDAEIEKLESMDSDELERLRCTEVLISPIRNTKSPSIENSVCSR